jgi:predicted PurR-regulated permease PerM
MKDKAVTIEFSLRTVIWAIITVAAIWLVFRVVDIIVIVFLSYIFAAAINPTIDRLEKRKIPRFFGILSIYVGAIAILVLLFTLIIPPAVSQVKGLAQNSGMYIGRVNSYIHGISPDASKIVNSTLNGFAKTLGNQGGVLSQALGVFSGMLGLIVVLFISFYLLLQKNGIEKAIAQYMPSQHYDRSIKVARKISLKMSAWLRGQLFLSVTLAILDFLALTILGVPLALTLAIISGFLEFLPIIGPLTAGALAAIIALSVSPLLALIVIIWYVVLQQFEQHLIAPLIMKKTVGLNPVTIIVAVLVGGKILGILGILIAVPVVAALSVIVEEFYKKK